MAHELLSRCIITFILKKNCNHRCKTKRTNNCSYYIINETHYFVHKSVIIAITMVGNNERVLNKAL